MAEADDSQGGFLVPEEFYPQLMKAALEESPIMPRATVIPMKRSSIRIPRLVTTSRASTYFGGVVCYWTEEAATKTETKPAAGQLRLIAKKLVGMVYCSDELVEDSGVTIEAVLDTAFGAAIAFTNDEAFVNGTGVGQPLGIMNSGALISVTKKTGQTAATIVNENVTKMMARLLPESYNSSIWMVHPSTIPQLASMSVARGSGGGPTFLANAPFTIYGRPVFISEHCQQVGTVGDVILADWRYYAVGDRGLSVAYSTHTKFEEDETCWRLVHRVDGQPMLSSAITPKHGTDTLSAFVALATRA
jgi:HK97 family phage major capsid protein